MWSHVTDSMLKQSRRQTNQYLSLNCGNNNFWTNCKAMNKKEYKLLTIQNVFIWRHGGHVGFPNQSSGSWSLFLCKQDSFVTINLLRCWSREWKRSIHHKFRCSDYSLIKTNMNQNNFPNPFHNSLLFPSDMTNHTAYWDTPEMLRSVNVK